MEFRQPRPCTKANRVAGAIGKLNLSQPHYCKTPVNGMAFLFYNILLQL